FGNGAAGVGCFFGHVSASFEAVVTPHGGNARRHEGSEVVAIAEAEALEQGPEGLVPRYNKKISTHDNRTEQLTNEPKHGNSRQQLRTAHVERGRADNHGNGDSDFSGLANVETEKLGDVGSASDGDTGDRAAQSPQVNPARHP